MPESPRFGPVAVLAPPPDAQERSRALDPLQSFLVQAPAGSGKTHLLTQRFLRLLAEAERPDEIVAITFTNAAAAEMRQRILGELEKAEGELAKGNLESLAESSETESLPALAARAILRSRAAGWQILDQPHQLRITTIDAFCRELALKSPLSWGLLSSLGGRLEPATYPDDLYRQAARRTLQVLDAADSSSRQSVEALLRWRDNGWTDVETLIVEMLKVRTRWHKEFVFARDADWDGLRARLEAPFQRSAKQRLERLGRLLDNLEGVREFAVELTQFACRNGGKFAPMPLAECAELPSLLFELEHEIEVLEDAVTIYREVANFLLTKEGGWRKRVTVDHGFPLTPEGKAWKTRFTQFIEGLALEPGVDSALAALQQELPLRYSEEEWEIVRHCFGVLREAYGQLQLIFAETGSVDFTEIARIALDVLAEEDGSPSDLAIREADAIRHLLIDEFQDTSRNQHELLSRLISAWPDRHRRSLFCVGDPMQSIYGFRDAEVELFEKVKTYGVAPTVYDPDATVLKLEYVALRANFRTAPSLVNDLNEHFRQIFAEDDGSGVSFSKAEAARASESSAITQLHLAFTRSGNPANGAEDESSPDATWKAQLDATVELMRDRLRTASESAQARFRIAVLARKKSSLVLVAAALREAGIPFRAIELVKLNERPEVLDALSLARAMLNPVDRTAWLGVLRAPWCGLSLAELHMLTSADDKSIAAAPIPGLLAERLETLHTQGKLNPRAYAAATRVRNVLREAADSRGAAGNFALGTWLESIWKSLGGEATVNAEERENLRALWTALDGLAEGELDLLGPALKTALDHLYALPDPAASAEFGVQLMTIHKSKGLEFEMVIVPDLDLSGNRQDHSLMSWLERGVAGEGDLTEFLIAPIQTKGTEAGAAKTWVQQVKSERETQELRRLLYVAATRARDELHLFARPRFREKIQPGSPVRVLDKAKGLLATAWPAIGEAIESRFQAWDAATVNPDSLNHEPSDEPGEVTAIAAQAAQLLVMPSPPKPTRLRRLPELFVAPSASIFASSTPGNPVSELDPEVAPLYARTEGGMRSRLLGSAIHTLLDRLSQLLRDHPTLTAGAQTVLDLLVQELPALKAEMRRKGLTALEANRLSAEAFTAARMTASEPNGAWILAPHHEAISEARWSGVIAGAQRNVRPDRVFFAAEGAAPGERMDEAVWWIVDFKTSHATFHNTGTTPAALDERNEFKARHREQHQKQLEIYAEVLRGLRSGPVRGEVITATPLSIRTCLYYPRLGLFDPGEA